MAVNPMLVGGIGVGVTAVAVTGGLYAGGVIGGSSSSETQNVGNRDPQPEDWHSLSEDNGYSSGSGGNVTIIDKYNGKYSQKYNKYLVGVTTKNGDTNKKNDTWWEWAYRNRIKNATTKPKDKFSTVKNGAGTANSLKSVCDEAYQAKLYDANTEKIKTTDAGADDFLEDNIWTFCSSGGTKIKTVSEAGEKAKEGYTANTTHGGDSSKQTKLVASKEYDNDWFWKLREKEIFTNSSFYSDTIDANTEQNEFKKLWNEHKTKYKKGTMLIKAKCEEAYKATDSKDTKYPPTDLGKFCSLSGEAIS